MFFRSETNERDRSDSGRSKSNSISFFVSKDDENRGKKRSSSFRESIIDNLKRGATKIGEVIRGNAESIDASQKQRLLSQMSGLLDNLRLQCPQSHTGVIVAFSTETMYPLTRSGISFTWFRTGGHGSSQFTQVQKGFRPYYTPCCDDIGHRICLQCQDTFGEGYSRYIESDPVIADKLLTGMTESALKCGYFTTYRIRNLSLGMLEKLEIEGEPTVREAEGGADMNTGTYEDSVKPETTEELMAQRSSSALYEEESKFLLLEGTYVAHVSEKGLFIGSRASSAAVGDNDTTINAEGIRIPPSGNVSVKCSSPCAAVITMPLEHALCEVIRHVTVESTGDTSSLTSGGGEAGKAGAGGDTMPVPQTVVEKEWRAIPPWVEESVLLDPNTGISIDSNNEEEEEEVEEESCGLAAEEATAPATAGESKRDEDGDEKQEDEQERELGMVAAMKTFVEGQDRSSKRVKVCLVFDDRISRDAFVLVVRGIVEVRSDDGGGDKEENKGSVQVEEEAEAERRRACLLALPWMDAGTGVQVQDAVSQVSGATIEMGERLNHLELENVVLKKERIDLTMRLLALERHDDSGGGGGDSGDHSADTLSSNVSELYAQMMVQKTSREKAVLRAKESDQRAAALSLELSQCQQRAQGLLEARQAAEEQLQGARAQLQSAGGLESELKAEIAKKDEECVQLEQQVQTLSAEMAAREADLCKASEETLSLRAEVKERESRIANLEGDYKEQEALVEGKDALRVQLEAQVMAGLKSKMQQETELGILQAKLVKINAAAAGREKAEAEAAQARTEAERLQAQANVEKKRGEGLGKELKRLVKENNLALQEFERALTRKSEECNTLYEKLQLYEGSAEGSITSNDGASDVGDGLVIDSVKRFTSGALENLGTFARRGSGSKRTASPVNCSPDTIGDK